MIYSKIYSSIDQMGSEIQTSVAELLSQEIPNLQWLKEKDRYSHQDVSYYLFFKTGHDRPIGLIRPVVRLLNTSKKKFFLQRIFAPSLNQKWLNIQTPGACGQGFIFFPEYEEEAVGQVLNLINRKINHDYDLIQLTVPQHLSFDFPYRANMTKWTVYNTFHKNQENYEDYQHSLPEKLREKICQEEDFLSSQSSYELVSSEHFNGVFQKNEARRLLGKKMGDHLSLTSYQKIKALFLALYYKDHLLTMAVSLQGIKGQFFGDIIFNLDFEINSTLHYTLLQKLIMTFYQSPKAQTLRLLHTSHWPLELQRDLPSLQFLPYHSKTYAIPIRGKKQKKRPRPQVSL